MIKTEILFNRLLKLCLFISGLSFLLFIINLFFAIAFQAIDCSSQICTVNADHPFFRLTLIIFALLTVAFIIFARIIYYQITKEEKLVDARTYRSMMSGKDAAKEKSVNFSQTVLYQEIIKKKQEASSTKESKQKKQKEKIEVYDSYTKLKDDEIVKDEVINEEIVEEKVVIDKIVEEKVFEDVKDEVEETPELASDTAVLPVKEVTKKQAKSKLQKSKKAIIDIAEDTDEVTEKDHLDVVEESTVKVKKPVVKTIKAVTRTKADLITYLETHTDLNKNKGNKFLKFFAEVIKESLANNEDVELPGFGFFTTIDMPAKEAMNPQTNEIMLVDAHRQVRLRFTDEFKNIFKNQEVQTLTQLALEIDDDDENDIEDLPKEQVKTTKSSEKPMVEKTPKNKPVEKEPIATKPIVKKASKKEKTEQVVILTKTKVDIINFLEANTDLNKSKSNKFLKSFAEVIKEALANHEDVDLPGFGMFTTINMPAKEAMNPQTKEIMLVDAHRQVRLRFADEMKDVLKD